MAEKRLKAPRGAQPAGDAGISIRVDHPDRPELITSFANHLMATFAGEHFIIRVGQLLPPAIRTKEDLEEVAGLTHLEARQIARLAVPTTEFIDAVRKWDALLQRLSERGVITLPPVESLNEGVGE